MAIYIFLLVGVILVGIPLCSEKGGRSGRIIYCCAAAVVFIFIAAMRFDVGYDYNMYSYTYFNMKYMYPEDLVGEKMEKGFLLPLYVLNLAFENYTAVFVYTSILIYPAVFYFIYKNSSSPWISVAAYLCMGLFFNSLCFIRQVIASLIILYAMEYMDRKVPVRFFILVFAASVFHWSSLIMLVMFFLLKIKPGYIYLGIISAGTLILCIFSKAFMKWASEHFAMYRIYDPDTMAIAAVGLSPKFTVMFGVLFIICFVFRKRLIEKNPRNSIYINCLMYTIAFEAMGIRHAVLSRFDILIFLPPVLYMVPDLVQVIREYISEKLMQKGEGRVQPANICALACLSLYFAGTYVMLIVGNYNGVVPYASQIDKDHEDFVEMIITEEDDYDYLLEDDDLDNEGLDKYDEYYYDNNGYSDDRYDDGHDEQPEDGEDPDDYSYSDEEWAGYYEQNGEEDDDWEEDGPPIDEKVLEQILLDQIAKLS